MKYIILILLFTFQAFAALPDLTWNATGSGTFSSTTSPNTWSKTGGGNGYLPVLESVESIASGDAEIIFTVNFSNDPSLYYIGFQYGGNLYSSGIGNMQYAVGIQNNGSLYVLDNPTRISSTPSATNLGVLVTDTDTVTIKMESGDINVYVNDSTLVHTFSSVSISYPLFVGTTMFTNGTVNNIIFQGSAPPPPSSGDFTPFPTTPNPPSDAIQTKGGLLTSDGTGQEEFTACADGQVLIFDSAQPNGLSCGAN